MLAILSSKIAVLNEIRDCVPQKRRGATGEDELVHTLLVERFVLEKGCLCKDERIAILEVVEESVMREIHYLFNPFKQLCESIQCKEWLLAVYPFC